jgi:hypothetical protein
MSVLSRTWIELNENSLSLQPGGLLIRGTATVALNIGDAVIIDTNGTVDKSATAGEQVSKLGVVVGGESTSMVPYTSDAQVGDEACGAGELVLVCILGICHIIAENNTLNAIGLPFEMGVATAGKVVACTDLTPDTAIGYTLEVEATPAADDVLKAFITQA